MDRPVEADHVPVRRRGVRGVRRRHAGERLVGERGDRRLPQPDPREAARDHDRRAGGAERVRRGQRAVVRPDRRRDDGRARGRARGGAAGGRGTPAGIGSGSRGGRAPARPRRDAGGRRRTVGTSGRRGRREPRRPRAARGRASPDRRPTGRRHRPAADDRARRLRRRLRGGPRALGRAGSPLAHPGRTRRVGDRRDRATDRVRGERPAGRDARLGRRGVRGTLRCPGRRPGVCAHDQRRRPRVARRPRDSRRGVAGHRSPGVIGASGSRGRCAARRRRLDAQPHALASDRRLGPVRRRLGVLPPGRRARVARGRRQRRWPGPPPLGLRVVPRRRSVLLVRRPAAGPDGRRHRGGARGRAHVRRAREARDVHRHRDRPGANERRPRRGDREPAARRRPRRPRTDERPASDRAGLLRDDRGPGSRRPARSDPPDAHPSVARGARRRLRRRGPMEATPLLPA